MLHAVVLAGGSGTRFWPLSRQDRPKQFLSLAGERSLLQATWDRLGGLVEPARRYVVASDALADGVREQLGSLAQSNLLTEPCRRDTAAAVALAARVIRREDPDAVLAVLPADHVISPEEGFRAALADAAALAARPGRIVTLGIPPRSAHTGYGYIQRAEPVDHPGTCSAYVARSFREKPDAQVAAEYLADGGYLWNSGVFVWSARTVLEGLERQRPQLVAAMDRIAAAWGGPDQDEVLRAEYAALEPISIDYALLEHASDVVVLEATFSWDDVGSWSALPGLHGVDQAGNTIRGAPCVARDAEGCLVQGDGRLIALLGVRDLVVVQTPDATLVVHKDRVQEIKALVGELEGELEPYR